VRAILLGSRERDDRLVCFGAAFQLRFCVLLTARRSISSFYTLLVPTLPSFLQVRTQRAERHTYRHTNTASSAMPSCARTLRVSSTPLAPGAAARCTFCSRRYTHSWIPIIHMKTLISSQVWNDTGYIGRLRLHQDTGSTQRARTLPFISVIRVMISRVRWSTHLHMRHCDLSGARLPPIPIPWRS
jgi:hypothetical protein